jgi:NAD(P) transhydrogenase
MTERFDFVVIGSGPGGQKAAICAAKAGQSVAVIERARWVGGACVHYGTIPSKALRETALRVEATESIKGSGFPDVQRGLDHIVQRCSQTVHEQLVRNGIELVHGQARFTSPHEFEVVSPGGGRRQIEAGTIILAPGSVPRAPEECHVDHEHVFDADSVLTLAYLPASMAVLGGGVIACEYASVFARLGVAVTLIERRDRPLGFLDSELVDHFVTAFEADGGRVLTECGISEVRFNGVGGVGISLDDGADFEVEKALVALGRLPSLESLDISVAGLSVNARGALEVGADGSTSVPHIYAVGDVAGPPALATSAMEQGRRAVRRALGSESVERSSLIPTGIYTIPEIASVGAQAAEIEAEWGSVAVGRGNFDEVVRGQISDVGPGMVKLVADPTEGRLLGVHIVGHSATELIHIGQMAIRSNARVEDLVDDVFNFPTLAEAYRIAALDLLNRSQRDGA